MSTSGKTIIACAWGAVAFHLLSTIVEPPSFREFMLTGTITILSATITLSQFVIRDLQKEIRRATGDSWWRPYQ